MFSSLKLEAVSAKLNFVAGGQLYSKRTSDAYAVGVVEVSVVNVDALKCVARVCAM